MFLAQSTGAVEYTDCTSMSVLDKTLNNLMVRFSDAGALRNAEHPFIVIAPRSPMARNGSTW